MKEYLLLLRGGKPTASKTETENKAEMQSWGAYMGGLTQNGSLVGGLPVVGGGKTVFADSVAAEAVTPAKEGIVGGYLIVKADSLDQAAEIAKGCPHIANEGTLKYGKLHRCQLCNLPGSF